MQWAYIAQTHVCTKCEWITSKWQNFRQVVNENRQLPWVDNWHWTLKHDLNVQSDRCTVLLLSMVMILKWYTTQQTDTHTYTYYQVSACRFFGFERKHDNFLWFCTEIGECGGNHCCSITTTLTWQIRGLPLRTNVLNQKSPVSMCSIVLYPRVLTFYVRMGASNTSAGETDFLSF